LPRHIRSSAQSPLTFEELDPVPCSVEGVESAETWYFRFIGPVDAVSRGCEHGCGGVDVYHERRMRLQSRSEVLFNTDVEFTIGTANAWNFEPTAPTPAQERGFLQFVPAEGAGIKRPLG
jgi:hypothetical protein